MDEMEKDPQERDELEQTDEMLDPLTDGIELMEGIEKNLAKVLWKLSAGLLNIPLQKIELHLVEKKADSDNRIAEKKADSDVRIKATETFGQRMQEQIEVPEEYAKLVTDKSFENIIQEQMNLEEINVSEEYVKLAATQHIRNIVQEQLNLDSILEITLQNLQNTPQDDPHVDQNIGEISDDWLNEFRDVACKKSSEEAQDLFAKVLAGEIRKPGSISLLALTTLANMDQEVANLFNTFCSLCLVHLDDPNAIKAGDPFNVEDARLPILRGSMTDVQTKKNTNPSMKEFTEYSQSLFDKYNLNAKSFQLLLDHNLIVDNTITKYNHIWYDNELWTFKLPYNQSVLLITDIKTIPISGLALTSVGKELYNITKRHADPEYWKHISQFIQNYYEEELYIFTKS